MKTEYPEMQFDIQKITVSAKSRELKATYNVEEVVNLSVHHGYNRDPWYIRLWHRFKYRNVKEELC